MFEITQSRYPNSIILKWSRILKCWPENAEWGTFWWKKTCLKLKDKYF